MKTSARDKDDIIFLYCPEGERREKKWKQTKRRYFRGREKTKTGEEGMTGQRTSLRKGKSGDSVRIVIIPFSDSLQILSPHVRTITSHSTFPLYCLPLPLFPLYSFPSQDLFLFLRISYLSVLHLHERRKRNFFFSLAD